MNRQFLLSALFSLLTIISFGQGYQVQSKYFVYLQTEPAQPFYIKINGQKIAANASGYLILPQLKDGDYKLIVGFPDGKATEQAFNFKIDSKDKGYLIKDYGADGWGLFDLQSMGVQKAIVGGATETQVAKATPPVEQKPKVEEKKEAVPAEGVSDFTKVLSQAAKDPSLLEKPKEEPVEEAPKPEVNNTPSVAESQQSQNQGTPKQQGTENTSSTKSGQGVTLVYDDRNEYGQVDPITIFIPEPKAASGTRQKESKTKASPKEEVVNVQTEQEAQPESTNESGFKVEEKPAIPQNTNDDNSNKKAKENSPSAGNSGPCKSTASDDDFLKLRRTMASQSNDDNMISKAGEAFKLKCYTTYQVKYLSSMFLSNAGKFNFFKTAYGHISDKENFSTLGSEIKDQSYKEKFDSLINQ